MNIIAYLKKILLFGIVAYLLTCSLLYFMQKRLLFPRHVTTTVSANWHPEGDKSEQALVSGSCGDLHVAIWRHPSAKGTLMMFHGNGETISSVDDYVHAFHQLGYNLMTWDYPGYGRSTDCWFNQDMLLSDAETAYQWLIKKEKPRNVYLFGYSLGTGIALSVASRHTQNPVFLVAGYDAMTNVALDHYSNFLPVRFLIRYPLQTEEWVKKIQQPIYLIHGLNDKLILPERARMLVKNAKGKVKVEWVENAEHASNNLFEYRNRWLKRLLP
jgi:uncharacterized protein